MTEPYDPNNIFAKILRKEIPCDAVYENDAVLAFRDIRPQRKVHIVIIPKGAYTDMNDFAARASDAEIAAFMRAQAAVAEKAGVSESGYRIISNCGCNGGQEVPHLHFHLLAGEPVGKLVS